MEVFKTIENYSKYKISNMGNIINNKNKLLKTENNIYCKISLYNNYGIRKNLTLHRLLAINFIPNPNNYKCVNHIDGNKLNNDLSNLEWCTHSENTKHAYKIGLNNFTLENKNKIIKANSRKVIDTNTNIIYNSIKEAAKDLNMNWATLRSRIARNTFNIKYYSNGE